MAAWRHSGKTCGEFAERRGVAEGTLRWWAWRLENEGCLGGGDPPAGVSLVPVRVVEREEESGRAMPQKTAPHEDGRGVAWTLRTKRGELKVHGRDSVDALVAVVAAMLEDAS